MSKYRLTISINIDAVDDPDAREKSKMFLNEIKDVLEVGQHKIKLQKIFPNSEPTKVTL